MLPALVLVLACPLGGDIDADYARLVAQTARLAELRSTLARAEPEKRRELTERLSQAQIECLHSYREFCAQHCAGALSARAVEILRGSATDRAMAPLFTTYLRWALEHVDPRDFLSACDRLESRGHMVRLDLPRALALYAAGEDQDAFLLARDKAEELGPRGLFLLDILAAIHAGRGEYSAARKLYQVYGEDYGDKDDRRAYFYRAKAERIGRRAPALRLDAWFSPGGARGESPAWARELRGAVVVLDFWQSWCAPCRQAMPRLSQLQRTRRGRPFHILGLCHDDASRAGIAGRPMPGYDPETGEHLAPESIAGEKYFDHVAHFARTLQLAYPLAVATTPDNSIAYGVRTLPTVIVLDPEGRIAWISIGAALGFDLLLETLTARMLERFEHKEKK